MKIINNNSICMKKLTLSIPKSFQTNTIMSKSFYEAIFLWLSILFSGVITCYMKMSPWILISVARVQLISTMVWHLSLQEFGIEEIWSTFLLREPWLLLMRCFMKMSSWILITVASTLVVRHLRLQRFHKSGILRKFSEVFYSWGSHGFSLGPVY